MPCLFASISDLDFEDLDWLLPELQAAEVQEHLTPLFMADMVARLSCEALLTAEVCLWLLKAFCKAFCKVFHNVGVCVSTFHGFRGFCLNTSRKFKPTPGLKTLGAQWNKSEENPGESPFIWEKAVAT